VTPSPRTVATILVAGLAIVVLVTAAVTWRLAR
jgi:hypothetical protein